MLIQVCINVTSFLKVYAPGIKPFSCNFSNKRCTSVADCCSCNKLKIKDSSIFQKTISCLLRKLSAVNSKLRSNYFLYYISKDFANYLFVLDSIFINVKKSSKSPNICGQIMIEFVLFTVSQLSVNIIIHLLFLSN